MLKGKPPITDLIQNASQGPHIRCTANSFCKAHTWLVSTILQANGCHAPRDAENVIRLLIQQQYCMQTSSKEAFTPLQYLRRHEIHCALVLLPNGSCIVATWARYTKINQLQSAFYTQKVCRLQIRMHNPCVMHSLHQTLFYSQATRHNDWQQSHTRFLVELC